MAAMKLLFHVASIFIIGSALIQIAYSDDCGCAEPVVDVYETSFSSSSFSEQKVYEDGWGSGTDSVQIFTSYSGVSYADTDYGDIVNFEYDECTSGLDYYSESTYGQSYTSVDTACGYYGSDCETSYPGEYYATGSDYGYGSEYIDTYSQGVSYTESEFESYQDAGYYGSDCETGFDTYSQGVSSYVEQSESEFSTYSVDINPYYPEEAYSSYLEQSESEFSTYCVDMSYLDTGCDTVYPYYPEEAYSSYLEQSESEFSTYSVEMSYLDTGCDTVYTLTPGYSSNDVLVPYEYYLSPPLIGGVYDNDYDVSVQKKDYTSRYVANCLGSEYSTYGSETTFIYDDDQGCNPDEFPDVYCAERKYEYNEAIRPDFYSNQQYESIRESIAEYDDCGDDQNFRGIEKTYQRREYQDSEEMCQELCETETIYCVTSDDDCC